MYQNDTPSSAPGESGGEFQFPQASESSKAFLSGAPRDKIHCLGSPVEYCPRCRQEGFGPSTWRPHRHIGELKIRYICERHFDDLESNHHFDVPLCPICNSVLYLYEFNGLLGVSNARRLHKYCLKCSGRHVLPILDLFCQTKKGGTRCNSNFKLQWCYGTMVKRCESQKNRDHDLWWVRYKNEWKQRRTIIRYKKDFLSHLSDTQRSLLLGLGVEGENPPDPKGALGTTFDALLSTANAESPAGPKIRKRALENNDQNDQFGSKARRTFPPPERFASNRFSPPEHETNEESTNSGETPTRVEEEIDGLVTGTPLTLGASNGIVSVMTAVSVVGDVWLRGKLKDG